MAVTPSQIDHGVQAANPAVTSSLSLPPGLTTVALVVAKTSGPVPGVAEVAVTGAGLTWELVVSRDYRARRRIYVFRAAGTPTPGSLSIQYTGSGAVAEIQWSVTHWQGSETGNNGADGIGTPGDNSVGTGSNSLGLSTPYGPNPGDVTYVVFGVEEAGGTPEVSPGWIVLSSLESPDVRHLIAAWDPSQQTSSQITWTGTNVGAGGVIFPVIALGNGDDSITGTGALSAPPVVLAGSGSVTPLPPVAGTGALSASPAVLAGSGSVTPLPPVTGAGALSATPAVLAGSGSVTPLPPVTGAGALSAPPAVLAGVGATQPWSPVTGSGSLSASPVVLAGSGSVTPLPPVTGTGELFTSPPVLAGSGSVIPLPPITGTGALTSPPAILAGVSGSDFMPLQPYPCDPSPLAPIPGRCP